MKRHYAARNAVLPSIAGFAISLGFVVSGSVITEQIFSYPGIGSRLLNAVTNNDYALMQGVFLFITLAVLGANLLVDLPVRTHRPPHAGQGLGDARDEPDPGHRAGHRRGHRAARAGGGRGGPPPHVVLAAHAPHHDAVAGRRPRAR
ncbi:ABC transporter permease, partial [Agrobacterium sp. S2]|nr:ABC transporter permease [Agrobacterium sp. S2]